MDEQPIDAMGPWTIKAVPTETRKQVILAAQRENLTVGQWLERRVNEWLADGSPVPVPRGQTALQTEADPLARLERLAQIARTASPGKDSRPLQEVRRQVYDLLQSVAARPLKLQDAGRAAAGVQDRLQP